MMFKFGRFVSDDVGAVTIDWVALTAGVLLVATLVVFSVFNTGVFSVVASINSELDDLSSDLDLASQQ